MNERANKWRGSTKGGKGAGRWAGSEGEMFYVTESIHDKMNECVNVTRR